MLKTIGAASLDALIDQADPGADPADEEAAICRTASPKHEFLRGLQPRSPRATRLFKSFIGLGYYDCVTPSVILRNVLENPGWYTPYTPYQARSPRAASRACSTFRRW